MAYTSRRGKRPMEYASKSAHGHVINDSLVQEFLSQCNIPKRAAEIAIPDDQLHHFEMPAFNPIRHVIAVDGGFDEVPVQTAFPSSTICFFQFGALIFSIEDLENLEYQPFIDPSDMAKLKNIERLKISLPIRNVTLKNQNTLTNSVRQAIYDFFRRKVDDETLMKTLQWFIFNEYGPAKSRWILGSCPVCREASIPLHRSQMTPDFIFKCSNCGGEIYLTDVFRLHEAIDDELGAGGILGYVTTSFEQIVLVHMIRMILEVKPSLMNEVLLIKDGPLAFFGQTASLHKPMRELVTYLFNKHNLYLAGLEKSGPFVEHADEISDKLFPGDILILNNDYIYRYVLPGKADPSNPYGRTTYYSNKLIFKTHSGAIYVVSIPTTEINPDPHLADLRNLQVILQNVEKLKCDMYDNALLPVALANKLVSLANVPSTKILQRFALTTMKG